MIFHFLSVFLSILPLIYLEFFGIPNVHQCGVNKQFIWHSNLIELNRDFVYILSFIIIVEILIKIICTLFNNLLTYRVFQSCSPKLRERVACTSPKFKSKLETRNLEIELFRIYPNFRVLSNWSSRLWSLENEENWC